MMNFPRFTTGELYSQAYSKALDFYGDFTLEFTKFSTHLNTVIEKHLGLDPPQPLFVEYFQRLHTNDLYLCAACTQSSELAWHRFHAMYKNYIYDLARLFCPSFEMANDLAGSIFADLFLPDRSGQSRMASYDGKHSLATWLRVIVAHRAHNERERKWNHGESLDLHSAFLNDTGCQKVEANMRTNRYAAAIEDAFRSAGCALTQDEKLLLLWRYEEGLQVSQIAKHNGVHPSTITRHLQYIQQKIYKEIIKLLTAKYKLNAAAVEECIAEMLDNPHHSILACIPAG
jgi:RNA polymerase sigma factor, sigma-70 family